MTTPTQQAAELLPTVAWLFQHADGRQAVLSDEAAARVTANDPSWYRVGPVEIIDLGDDLVQEPAPAVPEGWKLVPIEPTPEMCKAAMEVKKARLLKAIDDSDARREYITHGGPATEEWQAMLAAAPQAPAAQSATSAQERVVNATTVEQARGFVAFGAGVYRIQQCEDASIVITFRKPGDESRAVGERASEIDQTPIPVEEIIVKLQFVNAAGLDSLEAHLRELRQEHWPITQVPQGERLGICCYGGKKPQSACASCSAWQAATSPSGQEKRG